MMDHRYIQSRDIVFSLPDSEERVQISFHDRFSSTRGINTFKLLPKEVRFHALRLKSHSKQEKTIDLALTDPSPYVRLEAARLLAEKWNSYYEQNGITAVINDINSRLNDDPKLFFSSRDPRLHNQIFNPIHAKNNLKLGVFMALQQAMTNGSSSLKKELGDYFRTNCFPTRVNQTVGDLNLAREIVTNNLELPKHDTSGKDPLRNFFHISNYAITLACLGRTDLKQQYYPDLSSEDIQIKKVAPRMIGILNCLSTIFHVIEEDTRDDCSLAQIKIEHERIIGKYVSTY